MKIHRLANFQVFIIGSDIKRFLIFIMILLGTQSIDSNECISYDMIGVYKTNNRRIYHELHLLPDGKCWIHACEKHDSYCLKDDLKYAYRHNYSGRWEKLGDTIYVKYELNDFIANLGIEAYRIQMDTIHRKLHFAERIKKMENWIAIYYMLHYDVEVINQTKYYIINDTTLEEKRSEYLTLRLNKITQYK